uniref:Uncharacterized protein n=1 Tax=Glossina austeni TaxID=7395 RepID=A0A1A9UWN1_GLOAU
MCSVLCLAVITKAMMMRVQTPLRFVRPAHLTEYLLSSSKCIPPPSIQPSIGITKFHMKLHVKRCDVKAFLIFSPNQKLDLTINECHGQINMFANMDKTPWGEASSPASAKA